MSVMLADKITSGHQERRALIYVRQSTPRQVREHRAGQANQYALVDRALALGWPRPLVQVIDDDLGQSGRDSARPGFQSLVAEVSLGHVGLILAYEASRLARNNTDWYRLLDLTALVGTLIADADGVFDPRQYHDRLLLGLHGMLSEAEWHFQRQRLDAGRQRQIAQGAYRQLLPTGLVRLEDGRVVMDPDVQVRHAIELVFARFELLGSCQKVLRSLRDEEVLLPRRQTGGLHAGQLLWKRPNESAVYEILTNPAYAGAFVFGRTGRSPGHPPGRRARVIRRPPDLGPRLPELWASGRFSTVQQKELLRSLIRRIILTRPVADAVELKIVWVSGAYSELTIRPAVQRTADLADFDRLIDCLTELSAAGHDDRAIAERLGAEGFRGARSAQLSADMVGKLRRANDVPSLRTRLRHQARFEGQWTTAGLARHLGVPRRWLDARIIGGTLPASQYPLTGHYLIDDDPDLLASLRDSFTKQHSSD